MQDKYKNQLLFPYTTNKWASQVVQRLRICLPMQDARDEGLIPESGRSPGEEIATHSSILAWKIPWVEEPGRLQPMGSQSWT